VVDRCSQLAKWILVPAGMVLEFSSHLLVYLVNSMGRFLFFTTSRLCVMSLPRQLKRRSATPKYARGWSFLKLLLTFLGTSITFKVSQDRKRIT
jgi:hypothetical protein